MHSICFLLKRNVNIYCSLLLIIFCSAYLTQLTSFSPFYFAYAFALLLFILSFLQNPHTHIYRMMLYLFILLIAAEINSFIGYMINPHSDESYYMFLDLMFNQFLTVFLLLLLSNSKNILFVQKSVDAYYYVAVVFGFADFIYRVIHRGYGASGWKFFYNYKFNSIMFLDSNWTGFIYMIAFAFFIYLRSCNIFNISKRKCSILLLLVLLSFSRAALFCCFIVLFFDFYMRRQKSERLLILSIAGILFPVLFYCVFLFFLQDGSFRTKLELLNGILYYIQHIDIIHLLFGNGIGSASNNLPLLGNINLGGHLYIVVKLITFGLVGFLLDIFFFLACIRFTNKKIFYLLLPFFICGLSMCPTNLSFMYVFIGLMIYIEQNCKKRCLYE